MKSDCSYVFVVDDELEVRRSLERLLSAAGYKVRTFESPREFLIETQDDVPGCLLLDLEFPGLNGIQLQKLLLNSSAERPIVFLTGRGDVPRCAEAMKAGAVDFLSKPVVAQRLFDAVDRALALDAGLREAYHVREEIMRRLALLTPREHEVLELVLRGLLNKQIAARLGTVEKTIKVHRGRVMRKMRARSIVELVHLASCVGIDAQFPPVLDKQTPPVKPAAPMTDVSAIGVHRNGHALVMRDNGGWLGGFA